MTTSRRAAWVAAAVAVGGALTLLPGAASAGDPPLPCIDFQEHIGRSPRNAAVVPAYQYTYTLILRDTQCDPVAGFPAAEVELIVNPPCANPVTLNPDGPSAPDGTMVFGPLTLNQGGGACTGPAVVEIAIQGLFFFSADVLQSPDSDGDGVIGLPDLAAFQQAFVLQTRPEVGDLDQDGTIALSDLAFFQAHFTAP